MQRLGNVAYIAVLIYAAEALTLTDSNEIILDTSEMKVLGIIHCLVFVVDEWEYATTMSYTIYQHNVSGG